MSQHWPRLQLARRYAALLAAEAAMCSALLSVAAWAAAAAAVAAVTGAGTGALVTRTPSLDPPPALAHSAAPAVSMILINRVEEKIQDLACCHFQENFCIYSGISVSCHFCMIYMLMCNVGKKGLFANLNSQIQGF